MVDDATVWGAGSGVLDTGVLRGVALVATTVVVAATVVDVAGAVAELAVEEVEEVLSAARGLSAGTGATTPTRVTETWDTPPAPLVASDPAEAGADVDFTALPTAKPMAIATTTAPPSSHQRCLTLTCVPFDPVPRPILHPPRTASCALRHPSAL